MLKANRFLKYGQAFFLLFFSLSLLSVSASVSATETEKIIPTLEKGGKGGFFNLEVKDDFINLQAEQASFKEILSDLEKKTGIKVNIFKGVENKKV